MLLGFHHRKRPRNFVFLEPQFRRAVAGVRNDEASMSGGSVTPVVRERAGHVQCRQETCQAWRGGSIVRQ